MCKWDVNNILIECIDCSPDDIAPEKHIVYDLLADSLALMDIVLRVEQRFGFTFDQKMIGEINSVASLYGIVKDNACGLN